MSGDAELTKSGRFRLATKIQVGGSRSEFLSYNGVLTDDLLRGRRFRLRIAQLRRFAKFCQVSRVEGDPSPMVSGTSKNYIPFMFEEMPVKFLSRPASILEESNQFSDSRPRNSPGKSKAYEQRYLFRDENRFYEPVRCSFPPCPYVF